MRGTISWEHQRGVGVDEGALVQPTSYSAEAAPDHYPLCEQRDEGDRMYVPVNVGMEILSF